MVNMCLTKQKLSISLDYYWIFEFKRAKPFLKQFRLQSWVNISLACLPAANPEFNVATHSGRKELQYHSPWILTHWPTELQYLTTSSNKTHCFTSLGSRLQLPIHLNKGPLQCDGAAMSLKGANCKGVFLPANSRASRSSGHVTPVFIEEKL